jgi:hypothetical protein
MVTGRAEYRSRVEYRSDGIRGFIIDATGI